MIKNLQTCANDIFLIGCYRTDEKKQIAWILGEKAGRDSNLYNVRLDKGRDGWVDKHHPKVSHPKYALLYEYEHHNDNEYLFFSIEDVFEASEDEMQQARYPSPKGSYLIYRLNNSIFSERIDIQAIINHYAEYRNFTVGKPIFISGKEIKELMRPIKKRDASHHHPASCDSLFSDLPTLEQVIRNINPYQGYIDSGLTSIDLFSGCGGLTKGFEMAGIRSIFASDIDENCEKTFRLNFPETPFLCKDIIAITKEEVDALLNGKRPDIIIGGPPCQGFSLANKRRNKVADDPRNKLFYGFIKVINWYSPRVFVMENVKGLLSMKQGQVLDTILAEFSNAGDYGYNVMYRILNASDFGVPQNRERVIFIGTRKDLDILPQFPTPLQSCRKISVDDAISDLPQIQAGGGQPVMTYPIAPANDYQALMRINSRYVTNHIAMKHTARLVARFKAIKPGESQVDVWDTHGAVKRGAPQERSTIRFSQNNQRLHGDLPAPTIAASFQSNFVHPHLDRNFTAREGARLQSFPDDFIFEGMRTKMSWEKGLSQYQQIGNAVPVLMAKAIGACIVELLNH